MLKVRTESDPDPVCKVQKNLHTSADQHKQADAQLWLVQMSDSTHTELRLEIMNMSHQEAICKQVEREVTGHQV